MASVRRLPAVQCTPRPTCRSRRRRALVATSFGCQGFDIGLLLAGKSQKYFGQLDRFRLEKTCLVRVEILMQLVRSIAEEQFRIDFALQDRCFIISIRMDARIPTGLESGSDHRLINLSIEVMPFSLATSSMRLLTSASTLSVRSSSLPFLKQ